MLKFSIIIVTHNSEAHIKKCLDSICNQEFPDYEIIVVDNFSTDRTTYILNSFKDRIIIDFNNKNEGFSSAVNKGIGLSKGQYAVTLNPDVILGSDFLSEIARNIETADENIGMIGVKILKIGDGRIMDSTGLILSGIRRFYDRGRGCRDFGQFDNQRDIFGPCAAAAIYKREMLEEIKINEEYFDVDYFLLLEDFDIAWRAKLYGWKSVFVPEIVCYHKGGISREKTKITQYYAFRNRYLLLLKNEKIKTLWKFLLFIPFYEIPRLIYLLIFNRYALKALKELKELAPKMLVKRNIMRRRLNNI